MGHHSKYQPRHKTNFKDGHGALCSGGIGIVKGDAELKLFHYMLKYNILFVAPNLSGNLIALMGYFPLEGMT